VADLFDVDGAREGGFLGIIALELRGGGLSWWRTKQGRSEVLPGCHAWRSLCSRL
jgi:hypothetical protein